MTILSVPAPFPVRVMWFWHSELNSYQNFVSDDIFKLWSCFKIIKTRYFIRMIFFPIVKNGIAHWYRFCCTHAVYYKAGEEGIV